MIVIADTKPEDVRKIYDGMSDDAVRVKILASALLIEAGRTGDLERFHAALAITAEMETGPRPEYDVFEHMAHNAGLACLAHEGQCEKAGGDPDGTVH